MSVENGRRRAGKASGVRQHVRKQLLRVLERQNEIKGLGTFLRQSQDRVESLRWVQTQDAQILASLPVAVYTTDAAGWITYYNEAAVALWGRRPALGQDRWCGSWRMYQLDGTPIAHDHGPMATAIREDREIRGITAIFERPDGTRVQVIPFPTPLHDANSNLIGAVNVMIEAGAARL